MNEHRYHIPTKLNHENLVKLNPLEVKKILSIGHGAIAERQRPTHELWVKKGIEVHCADLDPEKLSDCVAGCKAYVLPQQEPEMLAAAKDEKFDVLCINNIPEMHIITALKYCTFAKQIIIQKPQDLNFPLINTLASAMGEEDLRFKTVIHDHYRNKGSVAALYKNLPLLLQKFGRFKRIYLFLTEGRSVNDEFERAQSLRCGMIQDLAVHMIDLLLECLLAATEWRSREGDERISRRIESIVQLENCVKLREQNSILGDDVETLAALDFNVTEMVQFPADNPRASTTPHKFDVLVIVGKGLSVEQGVHEDLKSLVIEFEQGETYAIADLGSQGVQLISEEKINRHHGGLNRPLMLLTPDPPEHALMGVGGLDYPQWQSFTLGKYVAAIVDAARYFHKDNGIEHAYPYRRPLGDLITKLATRERLIRPLWGNLPPLTNFQIKIPQVSPHFD